MSAQPVEVLACWVAELSVSPNGLHEIRAGAVNARERPLVGYAATYELAQAIAAEHNRSAAVAELIEALSALTLACDESEDFAIAADSECDALNSAHDALARVQGGAA